MKMILETDRFLLRDWRKGYASEAALVTLQYGFCMLSAPEIDAFADVRNEPSLRILTKIGLNRGNDFEWEGSVCAWFEKKMNN